MGSINIIGLGPSDGGLITKEAWNLLSSAKPLRLRTKYHPAVRAIEEAKINFISYDCMYEQQESFDAVYAKISESVVNCAAAGEEVVYAVPGSPLVAEETVTLIRTMAAKKNINIKIYPGMSFLELLYARLEVDPINGMLVTDALALGQQPFDTSVGTVVTQLYDAHTASEVKLTLMDSLPDDYEVILLHRLGLADEKIERMPLYEIDRHKEIDYLTSLYVPKQSTGQKSFTLTPLMDIIKRLREPGGCPWDIVQTHKSLRRNLVEEVYEVIEAIDMNDPTLLCEELGDLLMQVVFHARMAEETGLFSIQDVVDGVTAKLVRRHPHVFGDVTVKDAGEVLMNWEAIKRQEKQYRKSVLDGIPKDLPSLMSAYKLQNKASKVGFDWPDIKPVWEKLAEEIKELQQAAAGSDKSAVEEELGDVLFTVVNLSRFLQVDAEMALLTSSRKFRQRFSYVEKQVKKSGGDWKSFSLDQLDDFWNTAKKL
ncbi:nucleoside triphosphate pyrophosphohydrolase [Pectinatus frisingensis]|uniref:nucleoside triphosphate pyrophosphohydrolase n=1 Tax=Pectinatus frisingensis TaxID=865 RepID=UPI0018C6C2C2|nr:nucleoside triphosphate pyrophosphohydrolase [Pectinatus frisingensis]